MKKTFKKSAVTPPFNRNSSSILDSFNPTHPFEVIPVTYRLAYRIISPFNRTSSTMANSPRRSSDRRSMSTLLSWKMFNK